MELRLGTLVTLPPPHRAIGLIVPARNLPGIEVLTMDGDYYPVTESLIPWVETDKTTDPIGVFQSSHLTIIRELMLCHDGQSRQIAELQNQLSALQQALAELSPRVHEVQNDLADVVRYNNLCWGDEQDPGVQP